MATILVVDDESAVRGPLGRILGREGHEVVFASGVGEACELLHTRPFDVVFSDIHMPGGSGTQLAQQVRRDHADIALVIITAVDDKEIVDAVLASHAFAFILKPFAPGEVRVAVASAVRMRELALENRRYRALLDRSVTPAPLPDQAPEGNTQME